MPSPRVKVADGGLVVGVEGIGWVEEGLIGVERVSVVWISAAVEMLSCSRSSAGINYIHDSVPKVITGSKFPKVMIQVTCGFSNDRPPEISPALLSCFFMSQREIPQVSVS